MLNEVNRLCGLDYVGKRITFNSVLKEIRDKANLSNTRIMREFGWTKQHFNIMLDKNMIPINKIHELCIKYKIELNL